MTTVDKVTGEDYPISIHRHEKLSRSCVLPLLAEIWSELMNSNLCSPNVVPFWSGWPVVFAKERKELKNEPQPNSPIGFIHYSIDENDGDLWIRLGGVHKDWRKRGIYRALYNELIVIAKEKDCYMIKGGISPHNSKMVAAAIHTDRFLDFETFAQYVR